MTTSTCSGESELGNALQTVLGTPLTVIATADRNILNVVVNHIGNALRLGVGKKAAEKPGNPQKRSQGISGAPATQSSSKTGQKTDAPAPPQEDWTSVKKLLAESIPSSDIGAAKRLHRSLRRVIVKIDPDGGHEGAQLLPDLLLKENAVRAAIHGLGPMSFLTDDAELLALFERFHPQIAQAASEQKTGHLAQTKTQKQSGGKKEEAEIPDGGLVEMTEGWNSPGSCGAGGESSKEEQITFVTTAKVPEKEGSATSKREREGAGASTGGGPSKKLRSSDAPPPPVPSKPPKGTKKVSATEPAQGKNQKPAPAQPSSEDVDHA